MPSLGSFSYDLVVNTQLGPLQQFEQAAKRSRAAVEGNGPAKLTVETQQATQAVAALSKTAQATAAQIAKPITVTVNTSQAQGALQKFSGGIASGLGFGTGAAVAVKGIDLVTDALKGAVEGGLKYNAQLETATQTLELFTGSSVQAQQALTKFRAYADFTPFDTDEVIQGGQAFIKSVNGDIGAMEKLVHLAGQLAATNPDRSAGGGFESATVALREVLGGQTESIAERFNIPRSTIQSLKDAGLEGVALAEALVKAAHGSEELVNKLSTSGIGQLSNFTSAIKNLEQAATAPVYAELTKQLVLVNNALSTNSTEWTSYATAVGNATVFVAHAIPAMLQNSQVGQIVQLGQALSGVVRLLGGINAQQAAELEFGGLSGAISRPKAVGPTSTEDPYADNIAYQQSLAVKYTEQSAAQRKATAEKLSKDLKEIEASTSRDAIRSIDDQTKAVREGASRQKEELQDVRDTALKAADQKRDAVIAGIESEQQAVSRARTIQDRAISDSNDAILAGLEKQHNDQLKGLDEQLTAIQKRGDAALAGLDKEQAAEDSRHKTALENINAERDAKIDSANAGLKALSSEVEQHRNRRTDAQLQQSLAAAQKQLEQAKTPAERATARNAVARAQDAINEEAYNRGVAARRAKLEADIQTARDTATTQTTAEGVTHEGEDKRITDLRTRIKTETEIEAKSIKDRVDAENLGYQQTVKDQQRTFELQARALADQRSAEDLAFDARKKKAADTYQAETDAAKKSYDDQAKALDTSTDAVIKDLDRQKDAWTKWREHIDKQIQEAGSDPKKLQDISLAPPPGTTGTQNAGLGGGEPPSRGEAASQSIHAAMSDDVKKALIDRGLLDGAEIGASVAAGVGQGINSEASQAVVKGSVDNQINTNVIAEAKGLLGIASPSTVFDQFGQDTAQGFADGFAKVDLKTPISAPFTAATADDGALPTFVTAMGSAGTNSAQGFQKAYELIGLGVIINSPFDAEVTTNLPNFVDAMGKAGTNSAAGFINGFKAKDLPNVLYREGVYDVIKEFQGGYQSWFNTGANSAQSFVNGFGWVLSNWKPFGSSSGSSGSGDDNTTDHSAMGGPLNVGRLTMVGELGPELIVPRNAGTVLPADVTSNLLALASGGGPTAGGGGSNVQVTNNFNISQNTGESMDALAERIISKSVETTIWHLDQAHRNQSERVSKVQAGGD